MVEIGVDTIEAIHAIEDITMTHLIPILGQILPIHLVVLHQILAFLVDSQAAVVALVAEEPAGVFKEKRCMDI